MTASDDSSIACAPQAARWSLSQAIAVLSRPGIPLQLFGVVRLLQAVQPRKELLGWSTNPDREPVRIEQDLLLGHTDVEVTGITCTVGDDADAAGRTLSQSAGPGAITRRAIVKQVAVGLLGPDGPMPFAWTEHAFRLERGMDRPDLPRPVRTSFLAFLNVLQRRQLSFLYRAWSDSQAIVSLDSAGASPRSHPIADRLRALGGFGHADLERRDSIAPEFKLAFAAVLSRRVRTPVALASMLAHDLAAPVRIEEFVPRWLDVPQEEQTALGLAHARLGEGAMAGDKVLDADSSFEVLVGPVDLRDYLDLMPGGAAARRIGDLVALYAGAPSTWRLRPLLRAPEVPRILLGESRAWLGWCTWVGDRPDLCDAQDLALPMSPDLGPCAA